MKALVHDDYRTFDVVGVETSGGRPSAEVLVRVAAGLHVGDCFTVRGAPVVILDASLVQFSQSTASVVGCRRQPDVPAAITVSNRRAVFEPRFR
jgi:hypothetical protein